MAEPPPDYHHPPDWFTRNVFNPLVGLTGRLGISLAGHRTLEVTGRKSGEPRRTPVNPLSWEGGRYLVAPRGNTQWVRNLRAKPEGRLILGRRSEPFTAVEVTGDAKIPLLRGYLKKWKWESGQFFGGVDADSSDEQLAAIADEHPAFKITTA